MAITPEYGEEELVDRREEAVERRSAPLRPDQDVLESQVHEEQRQARERVYLDPEENELHAAGQVCARCGAVMTANQDVRRLLDGRYQHEVCPRT
jgi:hypothetical protein